MRNALELTGAWRVAWGATSGAAREHPGLLADGVELIPEIVDLMPLFEPENRGPFEVIGPGRSASGESRSGITVTCADARRFIIALSEVVKL